MKKERSKRLAKQGLHKIVKVSWIDADEDSGWSPYKKESPWVINTIGYLIEKNKRKNDFIVIANSHIPETNVWSGISRIPGGMVIKMETLSTAASCGYALMDDDTLNNT